MFDQKRRKYRDDDERASPDPEEKLKDATTLYVGNLSFYTTEEQIHELFSKYVFMIVFYIFVRSSQRRYNIR